jgi:hypothetical protein
MTGEQIYRNFTEAEGTGSLAGGADEVRRLKGGAQQLADDIMRLADRMSDAWQGDAADGARLGAMPLVQAHHAAIPLMDTSQDLSQRQVGSFGDAKNAVRPVPPEPATPDPWSMISMDAEVTYAGQVTAHRIAAQHNVDVMRGYENASFFNTKGQPTSYGTITPDGAVVVLNETGESTVTPPPTMRRPTIEHPAHKADIVVQPGERPPVGGAHPVPATVLPPRPTPDGPSPRTEPSHVSPPPGSEPAVVQPSAASVTSPHWTTQTPAADSRGGFRREHPGNPQFDEVPASGREVIRSVGGRPGEGRVGGGRGEGRMGGGFVAPAAERSVNRSAGTKGGPAIGPLPGGKGKGGEEEEHQRASFLREEDPESVFGTDEKTTPPVIE